MRAWLYAGFALILSVSSASGETWQPLKGADIGAALAGVQLAYTDGASQRFYANGHTEYQDGRPSAGQWQVRGDQYCSVWPPSASWVCYDMFARADWLRFVGDSGVPSDGRVVQTR